VEGSASRREPAACDATSAHETIGQRRRQKCGDRLLFLLVVLSFVVRATIPIPRRQEIDRFGKIGLPGEWHLPSRRRRCHGWFDLMIRHNIT
jgi:hypothetical protein